ncbi:anti-anti-sigma factor [Streptomyces collinus]|uniref:anti-anti-sigma factor n=1 Tax=Streptomyces collinus TaxID=42684 RepID=UPI00382CF69F
MVPRLDVVPLTGRAGVRAAGALADAALRFGTRRLVLDRPPAALPRMLGPLWPGLPAIEVAAA